MQYLAFYFSTCKNHNARTAAGISAAETSILYIFSHFHFFTWGNHNVRVVGIKTDL